MNMSELVSRGFLQHCRSCKAEVVFATNEYDRAQIIDASPSEKGNLRMYRDAKTNQLRVRRVIDGADPPLFIDHHATCPEGKKWRR